ncbi:hypothetical protein [Streptomyces europaeiscabiei]|uniref:hypothetical protein n=1 Tax=Streptomyces europaeiscabiei TaxID=146819 RepID=UPI0029BA185C|nr:hypothetical protein [Streptomyces europaeiscabiei]MDX3587320.1 hypothetical protein [Streptomyces europaeiscabiei]
MTTTDKVADGLAKSREAIENLINLYLDNVPAAELDREQLAETVYEGLSDELDRLYRITATADVLADRWERLTKAAPNLGEGLLIDEPTPVQQVQIERATTYGRAVKDLREVLTTGRIPHDLMTDAELGG